MNAYRVHLIRGGLDSFANTLIWTAMTIYQIQIVGMTPLQLVLAGTTLELTVFLCEIPTGIVADMHSRRLSSLIGFFIIGVACLLQGAIPTFGAVIAGHALWGFGYTFTSGAYNAWLVDEIGQENAGNAFIRGSQVERITALAGIVISVVLGSIHLQIPILLGGAIIIGMAVFLVFAMKETGFHPTPAPDRNTWQKMGDTFREGVKVVRRQPVLLSILAVGVFIGLYSEGWDRLWQAHLLRTFDLETVTPLPAIVWFGGLRIASMVLGVVAAEVMRRRVKMNQPRSVTRAFFWLTGVMVVGIILYGLAPSLAFAMGMFLVFVTARSLVDPLFNTWSNQHIESHVRATVLSMQSQIDAIGQTVGGPPLGAVGELSLRAAFVTSGLILSPALFILRRVMRTQKATAVELEPIAQ
ncbi:MAG TPA: MFS transporter [Oceanobacillus sp.]|nr:MFS transporter [Oceanobacillus sp.]